MTPKEKCLNVWNFIKDHPGMDKDNAYDELGYELNHDSKLSDTCEACKVATDAWRKYEPEETRVASDICFYCPVRDKWPDENGVFNLFACEYNDGIRSSAYSAWMHEMHFEDVDEEILSAMASLIVEAIEKYWRED